MNGFSGRCADGGALSKTNDTPESDAIQDRAPDIDDLEYLAVDRLAGPRHIGEQMPRGLLGIRACRGKIQFRPSGPPMRPFWDRI